VKDTPSERACENGRLQVQREFSKALRRRPLSPADLKCDGIPLEVDTVEGILAHETVENCDESGVIPS